MGVQEFYEQATDELLRIHPDIESGRMFGSAGLKIAGKTFAMVVKGELVIKLPGARVDELTASGIGRRFDPGHGRLMKEWLSLIPSDPTACRELMGEALDYVAPSTR